MRDRQVLKSKYRNKQSCRWRIDWDSGDRVETNTNTRKTKPEVDWWIDWETGHETNTKQNEVGGGGLYSSCFELQRMVDKSLAIPSNAMGWTPVQSCNAV